MARLLILDDDEDTLTWMSAALTGLGHEVQAFRSGRDALRAIVDFKPELILADILMPEMDGLTFVRLVRKLRDVPVMFVSIAKKEAEAILTGAAGYVKKPCTAAEIRAAVDEVLGHRAHKSSILVVDDDEDIRELYRSFLADKFTILDAEDGSQALDRMHHEHVDLAIVDVHMPVMNGIELIRAMRADHALQDIPVIVQTSDLTALKAPVWRDLHVSQLVDKLAFLQWLDNHIAEHTGAGA